MEKITMQELKEKIKNDEALRAKADQITGSGEELQQKIKDFATSLGYEIAEEAPRKMSLDDLDAVSGGNFFTLTEEDAKLAGIDLIKEDGTPGKYTWYHNYGEYYFRGKKINTTDALGIFCTTRDYCKNGCQFRSYDEYIKYKEYLHKHYVPFPLPN